MNGSIFPIHTLKRETIHWEDYLHELTPVEEIEGIAFKRDDSFAPLGYSTPNGGKVRQLIWLLSRLEKEGCEGVLYGCSVLSDVSARLAVVGAHFGLPTHLVLGASRFDTAVKHENIAIAVAAGAELRFIKVAYNPQLQRETARLIDTPEYAGWYRLGFGVAPLDEAEDEFFEAFYALSAQQVKNLPARRTLILPAGSCNSAISILYGLSVYRPAALEKLVMVAVGPDKQKYLHERLDRLAAIWGIDIQGYLRELEVELHDLHGTGWAKYADRIPWRFGDLDLHPTYEGKIGKYLTQRGFDFSEATFWVVGSEPKREALIDAFSLDGLDVDLLLPGTA